MVKTVTISDREYRLLKRTNSVIQKNVNFLEAENRKNNFYYKRLRGYYVDVLDKNNKLEKEINNVHQQLYDETYNSNSLRYELDELNKKYTNLVGEYEMTLCKLADAQDNVKEEENVNPWSGRII